jgi:hypothetical protein
VRCEPVTFFAVRLFPSNPDQGTAETMWEAQNVFSGSSTREGAPFGLCARSPLSATPYEIDLYYPDTACRTEPLNAIPHRGGGAPQISRCPETPEPNPPSMGAETCSGKSATNARWFTVLIQTADGCASDLSFFAASRQEAEQCAGNIGNVVPEICNYEVRIGDYPPHFVYVNAASESDATVCAQNYNCSESCSAVTTAIIQCASTEL